MAGYKPYSEYKYSGVEWIGDIPAKWEVKRIKHLATEEFTLFTDGDWIESKDIVYDESHIRYITTGNIGEGCYKEQGQTYITDEKFMELNCTEIYPGDLIISRLNPPIGRSCIIPDLASRIVTSVDNVVLRPDKKYNKEYLKYAMSNRRYFEYTSLLGRGATMQRISRGLLGDIPLPIPSTYAEQKTIARFLDHKTSQIDALISKKESLLDKLNEKRAALIFHAVTKGLDSTSKKVYSGVKWIGNVPAHWGIRRIKYVATYNDDSLDERTDPDFELEYVDISSVNLFDGIVSTETMSFEKSPSRARRKVKDGDTIISTVRTYLKAISAIKNPPDNLIVSTGFAVIRPKKDVNPKYLGYLLQSEGFIDDVMANSYGVSYPAINASVLVRLPAVLPDIEEQEEIVCYLDRHLEIIKTQSRAIENAIEKLEEYRAALIVGAITGKIDVRNYKASETELNGEAA